MEQGTQKQCIGGRSYEQAERVCDGAGWLPRVGCLGVEDLFMMWKVLIIVSLDENQGDGGSAVTTQVAEFETKQYANDAYDAVMQRDDDETYTQIEAVKLYRD